MGRAELSALAMWAGWEVEEDVREAVVAYLEVYWREVQGLREVELPDDVEPLAHVRIGTAE
jgi:hypothetical protein